MNKHAFNKQVKKLWDKNMKCKEYHFMLPISKIIESFLYFFPVQEFVAIDVYHHPQTFIQAMYKKRPNPLIKWVEIESAPRIETDMIIAIQFAFPKVQVLEFENNKLPETLSCKNLYLVSHPSKTIIKT